MKYLSWLTIGCVLGLWLLARPAEAADLEYTSFDSQIVVNPDTSLSITETIKVHFFVPKHGIFRNIPFRYELNDGRTSTIPIDVTSVTQDGQQAKIQETKSDRDLNIRIGDANRTISGDHTYVISYGARAATNFFDDHDELYWNITGSSWDGPLAKVSATVTLPDGATPATDQLLCFTGDIGSTEQDCTISATGHIVSATSEDFLTVVIGWPKGFITKPTDYDQLRFPPDTSYISRVGAGFSGWLLGLNVLLTLSAPVWVWWLWATRGRDPKGKGTIVAQYEPPAGLTPGEMGVLIDERAHQRDIVATIIDLAVRKFLMITEVNEKKLLGLLDSKDYRLDRLNEAGEIKLKKHERDLLSGIFGQGTSKTLSGLKGKLAGTITKIKQDLYDQVAKQGLFVINPQSARNYAFLGGLGVAIFGGLLGFVGIWGVTLTGLLLIACSGAFPRRTAVGVEAYWHAKGFKLFLETAEKYRLQWQEKEHIFEQYLPYAMAFGVAEKWTKTFEGIQQASPDWYHGSSPTFNALVLWSAMNSFTTATERSFAPPAASGSSGFGGGGFSGGGGGGGGGGGW